MKKSKLNQVIEEIKKLRGKEVLTFGQPQTLKNELDTLEIDVIDVLENFKGYEIDIDDIDMDDYIESESGNSYNWLSPVSNHINYTIYKNDDHYNNNIIAEVRIHRYGDVRSNYTDYFYLSFSDPTEFFEVLLETNKLEYVEVDGVTYTIYINILSDTLEVNSIDGGYIGSVCACDMDELKSEIKYLVD